MAQPFKQVTPFVSVGKPLRLIKTYETLTQLKSEVNSPLYGRIWNAITDSPRYESIKSNGLIPEPKRMPWHNIKKIKITTNQTHGSTFEYRKLR